jgi:hypothetical protein
VTRRKRNGDRKRKTAEEENADRWRTTPGSSVMGDHDDDGDAEARERDETDEQNRKPETTI